MTPATTPPELRELYQEFILDHGRHPRNRRLLAVANRESVGENPLCGDRIVVRAEVVESGRIRDIGFQGRGCAISTAAASTMTEAVKGMTRAEAEDLFERFQRLVTGAATDADTGRDTGHGDRALVKLGAFAGVAGFPMRVKCATLPWHTLMAALRGEREKVTTE